MAFVTLQASLILNTGKFTQALNDAANKLGAFSTDTAKGYKEATKALHKHSLGLKDTARIVQGIMVSQAFYQIAGQIRNATSALMEFNEQLDYSQIVYSAMFGSTELSDKFIKSLQELSVNSIFGYDTLDNAAKKMLAYGIEYKNLLYVMEGLTNLGAMSGDSAALDRVAYALGQIYAKGTLKAEEMRQLANAYVPIQKILSEKLGLSEDDLASVGDLQIPAEIALDAIVDYANEKFGEVGEAAMYTITGLKNRITDTFKVLGSDMLMPLTIAWKSFLAFVANGLATIRTVYNTSGIGGIFEYLVPDPNTQKVIRTFLADLLNFLKSVGALLSSVGSLLLSFGRAFVAVFSVVGPIISAINNVLAGFIKGLTSSAVASKILQAALSAVIVSFILVRLNAIRALVITAFTKAVYGLAKAMFILTAAIQTNPIGLLAVGIGVALIGVAAASDKANNSLGNFLRTIFSFGSASNSEDILQPTTESLEDAADASEDFSERFVTGADDIADSLNNVDKSAKKTSKDLFSFDEVFKLPSTSSASDDADAITDLIDGLNSLTDGLGESLIPDIPDFSDYADQFANDLYGNLFEAIKRLAKGAADGVLIGGLVGFAIGGLVTGSIAGALAGAKLGAKIGAVAGGAIAAFWPDAYEALEEALKKIAVAGSTGLAIGALVGFVLGGIITKSMSGALTYAQYGAMLGAALGTGIGAFWALVTEDMNSAIAGLVTGGTAGAVIGGLLGLALGAFITKTLSGAIGYAKVGASVGALLGGAIGAFWKDSETSMSESIANLAKGAGAGAVIGGLIGLAIGAFATKTLSGAMQMAGWGSAIGATLGGLIADFWSDATEYMRTSIVNIAGGAAEGALIGGLLGFALGAFVLRTLDGALSGAKLGATAGTVLGGAIQGFFGDAEKTMGESVKNLMSSVSAASTGAFIGGVLGMLLGGIIGAFAGGIGALPGAKLGASLGAAVGSVAGLIADWWKKEDIGKTIKDSWAGIWDSSKWASGWSAVSNWFSNLWTSIKDWFFNIGPSIANWWNNLWADKETPTIETSGSSTKGKLKGHATGGIFNREHVARFAEGNKAEAVIPLENTAAMQPFVSLIADGVAQGLAPQIAAIAGNMNSSNNLTPVYVGTLIADDRGLKELERKMRIIRVQEERRGI